ncbi:unnamed protein product, partial [Polarella glacialis]
YGQPWREDSVPMLPLNLWPEEPAVGSQTASQRLVSELRVSPSASSWRGSTLGGSASAMSSCAGSKVRLGWSGTMPVVPDLPTPGSTPVGGGSCWSGAQTSFRIARDEVPGSTASTQRQFLQQGQLLAASLSRNSSKADESQDGRRQKWQHRSAAALNEADLLARDPLSPRSASVAAAAATAAAEEWVSTYVAPPLTGVTGVSYPCGASLVFESLSSVMASLAADNAHHRDRIVKEVESGQLMQSLLRTYQVFDLERCGRLAWGRGQLRDFVQAAFQEAGLRAPAESQIYQVYTFFDPDRQMFLCARDCLCLVDALLRAAFSSE